MDYLPPTLPLYPELVLTFSSGTVEDQANNIMTAIKMADNGDNQMLGQLCANAKAAGNATGEAAGNEEKAKGKGKGKAAKAKAAKEKAAKEKAAKEKAAKGKADGNDAAGNK